MEYTAKLFASGDHSQDGCTSLSHRTRLGQAGLILGLAIVFLLIGNVVLERGIVGMLWGTPASAVFVANYDDPEKNVRWDVFKSKYKYLDPNGIGVSGGSVSIALPNVQKQLLYGNNVVSLEPTVSSKADSAFYRILLPFVLILVLDAQDNIRGKLLSPIQMSENATQLSSSQSWSVELSASQFWFRFPPDMRGATYTVIVELFGYWIFECCGDVYVVRGLQLLRDAYYGLLPQLVEGGNAPPLLTFTRQSFKAPAPELTLQSALSYASIASTFTGAILGVIIDRRKRIYDFMQNNVNAILLFWISVILFVVMVILIVTLK